MSLKQDFSHVMASEVQVFTIADEVAASAALRNGSSARTSLPSGDWQARLLNSSQASQQPQQQAPDESLAQLVSKLKVRSF